MSELHRLQREMQRAIMAGAQPPAFVRGNDTHDRARRFGIYASAYRSRLHEALAHSFPLVQAQVGEPAFAAIADGYLDSHPSTHPSIRTFGHRLAEYLQRERADEPWLAELARFEWALGDAFDAPDDASLSMDALASVAPEQWANLRFQFARSVHRLTLVTNAPALYAALAEDRAAIPGRREQDAAQWLVWRQQRAARYRSMTYVEALAFDALASGDTFGDMCAQLLELSSDDDAPLQAAACLKRWLADELIVTFSLAQA